jgi:hypothetical protein
MYLKDSFVTFFRFVKHDFHNICFLYSVLAVTTLKTKIIIYGMSYGNYCHIIFGQNLISGGGGVIAIIKW